MFPLGPIASAIMALAPGMPHARVDDLADIVCHQAARRSLPPRLVVAFIGVESQFEEMKISPTYDWGLGQTHVSAHSFPELRGREWVLFVPVRAVKATVDLMAMWRGYHERRCRGRRHDWLAHMKWGRRVRNGDHAARVRALESWIARRTGGTT
jgi:hypothetical protein